MTGELSASESASGAVAILDAIAFRGVWSHRSLREAAETWERVVEDFKTDTEPAEALPGRPRIRRKISTEPTPAIAIRVAAFSDTLVVTAVPRAPNAPSLLGLVGHIILPYFRAVDNGVFLRGAISFGKFYQSERIVLGPAVDEAIGWYNIADWFGVMFTPSATYQFHELGADRADLQRLLTEYDVPLRDPLPDGRRTYRTWVASWPSVADDIFPTAVREAVPRSTSLDSLRPEDQDFKVRVMKLLAELPTKPSEVGKHRNTLEFYDWVRQQSRKT
jgi:hypothetical protein